MSDPYRTACPPPPEPIFITCEASSLYVQRADILFQCEDCGNSWRLTDTFQLPWDNASFQHLQAAWSLRHNRCNR